MNDRNIHFAEPVSPQVENAEQMNSSWFAKYPTTEPDQGMVEAEVDGAIALITLDEYRRIKDGLVDAVVSDRPASRYLNQEVA